MGVFQGSRCNSVRNTTNSFPDPRPLPYPACGERGVSTEGLGGYCSQALASLARANPYMPRLPFSNSSHTKVSRQLLATSITPCRTGTGYYCHLIRREGGKKRDGEPSFVLVEPTGRTETCRFVQVPWDLKPDLKANQGTSSFPASLPNLPSAQHAMLHLLLSPHSLLLPRTCCSTSLPAPFRSPHGTTSNMRFPKSTEILSVMTLPSFSCKPP